MSKKVSLIVLLTVTLVFMTGCSVKVDAYSATGDNVTKIRELNTKLNVKKFTATNFDSSVMCRAANPVSTPREESFAQYIENALIEELKMAGYFNKNAQISLHAHLNELSSSSGMTDAHWTFDIKVISSNGNSIDVVSKYEYPSSFNGSYACRQDMPKSFKPSVQKLIYDILNHPDFEKLIL